MKAFDIFSASISLISFISHMVQMKVQTIAMLLALHLSPLYPTWFRWKREIACSEQLSDSLYIPHGSDERMTAVPSFYFLSFLYIPHGSDESTPANSRWFSYTVTLYPTWFRWKTSFLALILTYSRRFISHMVQMKVDARIDVFMGCKLYIPHGSDESQSQNQALLGMKWLYIPHGSDERDACGP